MGWRHGGGAVNHILRYFARDVRNTIARDMRLGRRAPAQQEPIDTDSWYDPGPSHYVDVVLEEQWVEREMLDLGLDSEVADFAEDLDDDFDLGFTEYYDTDFDD